MKAIHKGQIYHVQETYSGRIELLLDIPIDDPRLIIDPTDAELEEARALLDEDEVVYRGG